MQFVYALSFLLAVGTINAYEYGEEAKAFNIDDVVNNVDQLNALAGCFLDEAPCSPLGEQFKNDFPDAYKNACANCKPAQKVILKKFLEALQVKAPAKYDALNKKYDPQGNYLPALKAAIA